MRQALEVAERHASILQDWYGHDCLRNLISVGDRIWFVKCKDEAEKKRDLLATHLAAGWLNVAEARELEADELVKLQQLDLQLQFPISAPNTYLVRFALDYHLDELPICNPDVALAHELVFSIWVRRRDAHAFNRAYKDGVPIFFDFGTAFLGEPRLVNLKVFFRRGSNPGWPGWWRLWPCGENGSDTLLLRQIENASFEARTPKVLVPVRSHAAFFEGLCQCESRIASLSDRHILRAIEMAGFTGPEQQDIHAFLIDTQRELPRAGDVLRSILLAS